MIKSLDLDVPLVKVELHTVTMFGSTFSFESTFSAVNVLNTMYCLEWHRLPNVGFRLTGLGLIGNKILLKV